MISLLISFLFVCIHAYSDNRGFVLGLNRGRESDANGKVNPPGEKLACLLLQRSQSECVLSLIRICGFVRAHERSDVCDITARCVQVLQRLILTVSIFRLVVEMESSLLLHIAHAIIPLASQRASTVIR